MIKATAKSERTGRPVLILGLSKNNMDALLKGQPIPVKVDDLFTGLALDVVITGGQTEEAIVAELRRGGLVNVETEIRSSTGHADHYRGGPREA